MPPKKKRPERTKAGEEKKVAPPEPSQRKTRGHRTGARRKNTGQTRPDHLELLESDPEVPGTGLFEVAAPELPGGQSKLLVIPDLRFDECAERGTTCMTYKWVPQVAMTYDEIMANGPVLCIGEDCRNSLTCPPPCICSRNRGYKCIY